MFFLPLPIVVALMLATVVLMQRERLMQVPSGQIFAILLLVYCFQLLLIGIRWGYDIYFLLPLQAVLAVAWCPLAWLAFRGLSREGPIWRWPDDWVHGLPVLSIVFCIIIWPDPIDVILMLTYIVYAGQLIRLARRGPDALRMVRLSAVRMSHRALWITACFVLAFAVVDILIVVDIQMNQGQYAASIVAIANVPSIIALGLAAVAAGQTRSVETAEPEVIEVETDTTEVQEAQELMPKLQALLIEQELYKEPELNLQRLARKCGVPARRVSRAVNLLTEQNVSQWVNEQRIKAACELLKNTNETVTIVMHDVGFLTKSNFNREFKRITGTSPSVWRKSQMDTA